MRNKRLLCNALSLSLALAMITTTNVSDSELISVDNNFANEAEFAVNQSKTVTSVNGKLDRETVDSSADAKEVIEKVSNLLGINDADSKIEFFKSTNSLYNTTYNFKQFYKGLEVINVGITVVVDNETGVAESINSSFDSNINVDTNPSILAEDAVSFVETTYNVNVVDKAIVVFKDKDSYKLAWKLVTNSSAPKEVYMDAVNGEIIYAEMPSGAETATSYAVVKNNFNITAKDNIFPFSNFTVDITRTDTGFKLYDRGRNICLIPQGSSMSTSSAITSSNLRNYYTQLAVLNNVKRAYDFYSDLNWKGPNGNSAMIYIVPEQVESNGAYCNAFHMTLSNGVSYIEFGVGSNTTTHDARGNYGADIDIVTHEYTHGVTNNIVDWFSSGGETGALEEAYSDIMGELSDDTREWQVGTDQYVNNINKTNSAKKEYFIRDLENPSISVYTNASDFAGKDSHYASQVISHTAYNMYNKGISISDLKKIWFTSLDYLPHNSKVSFLDCRRAVLNAAQKVYQNYTFGQRDTYCRIIKLAFNEANIFEPNDMFGDFNLDGNVNEEDANTICRYVLGSYSMYQPIQQYYGDVNCDGTVNQLDATNLKKLGDMNLDGKINGDDVAVFQSGYSDTSAWLPIQRYHADMNGDGVINILDLNLLKNRVS